MFINPKDEVSIQAQIIRLHQVKNVCTKQQFKPVQDDHVTQQLEMGLLYTSKIKFYSFFVVITGPVRSTLLKIVF